MQFYMRGLNSAHDYPPSLRERWYWRWVRFYRRVRYGLPALDYYKICARCGLRGENHSPDWRSYQKGCWRYKRKRQN